MWDDITKAYNGEFGTQHGDHDRARLQMKLTRGVNRYALLPESEIQLITEAYEHDEKHKYERICARLAEMGGGKVWPWKPAQIEGHLVILGLEEKLVDEKNSLRRKRREAQRKRNAARAMPVSHESVDGITVQWVGNMRPSVGVNGTSSISGPVVTLPSQAHHHHFSSNNSMGMRRPSAATFEMAAQQQQQRVIVDSHSFSNEDYDEVMKQLEKKYYSNGGDQADMAVSPATAISGQHHIELPAQFYSPESKHEQF
ncbi:hypothetical protein MAPG_07504 [Magnaporthiopsis poae ATCC 64411]|uniref:Uncharacterized protein n=1 Tax=Magnaporthiopsis poae (strain ATCC 64411 / 73-15) TaxID=644358 RepID=A0A0C4E4V1_MAGP6|nr:hypothetical protein MAPG_07504 [Magnaporthiopsis poae ATCC 64411]